jgi:acyl-CoA synthetase (AMP-forming)/AMP-acid ligase II
MRRKNEITRTRDSFLAQLECHLENGLKDKPAYIFLKDGEDTEELITYGELLSRAKILANQLVSTYAPGMRALLIYPPGIDFVVAFLGCLYSGIVAVPTYPPRLHRKRPTTQRLDLIVRDCTPSLVLSSAELDSLRLALCQEHTLFRELQWYDTRSLDAQSSPPATPLRSRQDDDVAFLQYTSGSTGSPKGVMVSHGNILANQMALQEAMGQTDQSTVVGWLPVYHDMGLIGDILHPLYLGARCVFMSPIHFLHRPMRWLRAISKYQATISGGPNFAYDLCVARAGNCSEQELNLSSWDVAFTGAEPIRADTIQRFTKAFEGSGFKSKAFYPCYGLAEATLLVTGSRPLAGPVVKRFPIAQLEGITHPLQRKLGDARSSVSCGHPASKHRVVVVDPQTRTALNDGAVGEVWVTGPSVAVGYWNRPIETETTLRANLDGTEEHFLRTGDLGLLTEGELFLTGRIKDLILVNGRKIYPQDVEYTVEGTHSSIRPNSGAAFQIETDHDSQLIVAYEWDRKKGSEPEKIAEEIVQSVSREHEIRVHSLLLLDPGAIPKTSSGKIQRSVCRTRYLKGLFSPIFEWPKEKLVGKRTEVPEKSTVRAPL